MIPESERLPAVDLIMAATKSGAGLKKACDALEISVSTFHRWSSGHITDKRKGAEKTVTRRLGDAERQQIIDISCSEDTRTRILMKSMQIS
jgi:transposase-like protein